MNITIIAISVLFASWIMANLIFALKDLNLFLYYTYHPKFPQGLNILLFCASFAHLYAAFGAGWSAWIVGKAFREGKL